VGGVCRAPRTRGGVRSGCMTDVDPFATRRRLRGAGAMGGILMDERSPLQLEQVCRSICQGDMIVDIGGGTRTRLCSRSAEPL